jgi:hypothetical protein
MRFILRMINKVSKRWWSQDNLFGIIRWQFHPHFLKNIFLVLKSHCNQGSKTDHTRSDFLYPFCPYFFLKPCAHKSVETLLKQNKNFYAPYLWTLNKGKQDVWGILLVLGWRIDFNDCFFHKEDTFYNVLLLKGCECCWSGCFLTRFFGKLA